ncbi:MAG: DUF502 domain-containing protein [Bacteroidota bacterium]|mgnify:CR=1 FL=1|jgi:uncharacterized membrane protein|nr:DUF502 domain-containing protein [Bacteroidia bacterium]MBP7437079.1 DUF502 domain-containing protein [Bacteroidia bacterium]MBP7727830.1 DUF502 domain-containing protein [Bacteroidia bacterium]MBP7771828.1 DUF502 domain-containing protein [Bacteroidia bacterium]HPD52428.1 DUF502 domain-containing protein [Bacteroidia bacterium]
MKRLLNFFFQGLLFVVPIAVTLWVLFRAILWVDGLLPFQVPIHLPGKTEIDIPGLGLITIFLFIAAVGWLSARYIRNPLFSYLEQLIDKAPLVKLIYSSVKDLVQAFVGEKRRFNQPVLVRLEKESEINRIGFITQEDLSDLGLEKEKVAVYLPFSYSFAGELIILPRENIRPLNASGTDMMKFIISGGVTEIKEDGKK